MSEGDGEHFVLSETERNDALAGLVTATCAGNLTLEDFSHRTDAVLAAQTRGELVSVTAGVPLAVPPGPPKRRWFVMGTRFKRGRFVLPETTTAIMLTGELHVDLRGATLVGPEPTIRAYALLGAVRLLVPRGIHVEIDQTSILGGRTITVFGPLASPMTPVLRVRMFDLLGSVKVTDDPHSFSPDLFPGSPASTRFPAAALSGRPPEPAPPEAGGSPAGGGDPQDGGPFVGGSSEPDSAPAPAHSPSNPGVPVVKWPTYPMNPPERL